MFRERYGSKYGNRSQEYNGITYHSKKEAGQAQELDFRVKAGDIKSWERQKKISLDVNGHHITNYYIDFVITHNDESTEFLEVKGFETDVWRMKWRLFEALHEEMFPNSRLTVVR